MHYAEKVQLFTGLIILVSALIGYVVFFTYYKRIGRQDLLPFLKVFMLAGFLIGTHQAFEFLSLYTMNVIVYKIGLLGSIMGMMLYGISLEKLYNRNLYIKYLNLTALIIVVIYLFLKSVQFNALNFHLEHHSIFFWTFTWLILFLYWNTSALLEQKKVSAYFSRSLTWIYLLFSMTASFLIAAAYSLWTYYNTATNICITYPSIWCTFAFLQILVMPFFLYFLPHKMKTLPARTTITFRAFSFHLSIAFVVAILIIMYLSTTGCFNVDFILR